MKKYIYPEISILEVSKQDVICTSPIKFSNGDYGMEDGFGLSVSDS